MVQWVRKGVPLPLGAVHNRRSLVALDKLVDFIALCAELARARCAANELFLLSDNEDISTVGLLRKLARAYGTRPRLVPVPSRWIRATAGMFGKSNRANRLLGSLVLHSSNAQKLLG
jgi:nucleoside-diphosphate-sugar epimerase